MAKSARQRLAEESISDEEIVQVRVSARTPRARVSTPPAARAQTLAASLLEGVIGQLADYIEHSPAVERLIRVQTTQVLRELAHDPQLAGVIQAQAERYVGELLSHPEILEPLVRAQVDRYLDHLRQDPTRLQGLSPQAGQEDAPTPKRRKRKPSSTKIELE